MTPKPHRRMWLALIAVIALAVGVASGKLADSLSSTPTIAVSLTEADWARQLAISSYTSSEQDQRIKAAIKATQQPPPVEGTVLWFGSFESGTIDKALYPYSNFVAGHVKVVPDPLGSGQKVLEYAIADSDRPYSGATNPRGDVESPRFFRPGNEVYVGIPILFPHVPIGSGWFQVAELYGPPFGGSPPVGLDLGSGHLQFRRDANHGYDAPWTAPTALDGKWHTVIFHVRFATDSTGFVEVWYDGVQQKLTNGSTRISFATLDTGINWNGEPNFLDINNYRQAGAYPGTVTLFHGAPVVASTLAAAQSKLTLR